VSPTPRGAAAAGRRRAGREAPRTEPAHSLMYDPSALTRAARPVDPAALLASIEPRLPDRPNARQRDAFIRSFDQRVSLLWGPPGTGKTVVLSTIVLGWLEHARRTGQPLVIGVGSSTWTAIDHVLENVADLLGGGVQGGPAGRVVRLRGAHSTAPDDQRLVDVIRRTPAADLLAREMTTPQESLVVGGTWLQLSKLAAEAGTPAARWFDLMLLDEASQLRVAPMAGYFLLLREDAHVVLAGDDRQLGPVYAFQAPRQQDEQNVGLFDCAFTYMERAHHVAKTKLIENYRTNIEIAGWPRVRFYEGEYEAVIPTRRLDGTVPTVPPDGWPTSYPWSTAWADLLDPAVPVVALTYPAQAFTLANPFEAQVVAALATLYRLALEPRRSEATFWQRCLGLVTPHRAQAAHIRTLLQAPGGGPFANPRVATVDSFQGQERDVIVASYAVADKDFVRVEEEFILDPRRFNVTLTRARKKFILLLSDTLLEHLPADAAVARNAAHLQLFVHQYCDVVLPPTDVPYVEAGLERMMSCRMRGHVR
jgi:hypothetical protein